MFRASKCPSSGENHYIYATLAFFTLYGWIFSWWWALGCPKHIEKRDKKYLNRIVHLVGLFVRLYGDVRSTEHKTNHVTSRSATLLLQGCN